MKVRINSTQDTYPNSVQPVHSPHAGNTMIHGIHKPCADKKGIHCTGDKFGYVVDWQISEKKHEAFLIK